MTRSTSPEQIDLWKRRRGPLAGSGHDARYRLKELNKHWRDGSGAYLLEFVPMRVTTIFEVFTREVVRELVDHSPEFAARGSKLAKNSKIDFDFAFQFYGQELSVGDFIAHSISLNSIEQVLSVLSTLVEDFVGKLKASHPRWTEEANLWPMAPIIEDYARTVKVLQEMFKARHILTHELPEHTIMTAKDVEAIFVAADQFIDACDWVIVAELRGSIDRTQLQMNLSAADRLAMAEEELDEQLQLVLEKHISYRNQITTSQDAWQKFASRQSELVASQVQGGSMYPLVYAGEKEALVKSRIKQLREMSEHWMG